MGEFEFIDTLRARFDTIGDPQIEGIGDDCAVLPVGDEAFVVTTDMLVEGVHFLRDKTSARELAGKALAVNLSDIAAMGARPVASFLSVALPVELRGEWAVEFAEGYAAASERFGVKPAGGDTTSSPGLVAINVAVVGRAPMSNLKRRNAARAGDIIAVCGMLGASAAGLHDPKFRAAHNNPRPQVEEGAWLGARNEVRAMMDLSDGLAGDLPHILRGSGVGACIELSRIPTEVALEQAVAGGEDYVLLLTASADGFPRLAADFHAQFGAPLYNIGTIVNGPPEIEWTENGAPVKCEWRGFQHF